MLLGVRVGDGDEEADRLVRKLRALRVFEDADGRMNLSLEQAGGELLCVSNFTVYGDARKGNRPEFRRRSASGRGRAPLRASPAKGSLRRAAGSARTWPSSS